MEFTSHNHAEYRQKRLKRAAQLFCEISGIPYDHAEMLVSYLNDDRGTLYVHWRYGEPSQRQRDAFSSAWRLVGESSDAVVHVFA